MWANGQILITGVLGNLSFRARGPRNLMKALQCNDAPGRRAKPFVFRSAVIATIVLSTLGTLRP
jgi:hypothetical protein